MIDLTDLKCQAAMPRLLDWGATLKPSLGGVSQRLLRLGTRFAIEFNVPQMRIEAEGRRAIARLQMAKQQGGMVSYPQVEFDVGTPGAIQVSGTHTGGTTLNVKGGRPHYAVRQGQFFNIVKNGRNYLYCAGAQTILSETGTGAITLTTMLRTQLADNDVTNFGQPVIEGWLEGDELSWTLEIARTTGLSFSIEERA